MLFDLCKRSRYPYPIFTYALIPSIFSRGGAYLVKICMIETGVVSMSICGNRICVILRRHSRQIYIATEVPFFDIERFWEPRFSADDIVSDRGILIVYFYMHVILF